ncbi:MAG: cupredoxin domain-containing protein [Chloroflexi bacterium]|nr:cupredoxin domain-containing protein [Chloroflexota bacterium]
MEYVHTILAQIAASNATAAESLLNELEAHRAVASTMRGYNGMRVSRTAHPEGNVLLVVETRWANNNAMVDYSTARENAFSIVEKHQDILVPGSLQTHRLESNSGGESGEAPNRMYDRLALALFVPVGVLAFALVVIYGMSRIYLALPTTGASIMAICVALGILLISAYFATNPSVPRWQWLAVAVAGIGALAVGGTVAAVYDEDNKEVHAAPTVEPSPGGGAETPTAPGALVIDMTDNKFDVTELTVTAATEVVIQLKNSGAAIHNVDVAVGGSFPSGICKKGDAGCSDPANIRAGQSGTVTLNLAPGTYDYRCDFHPVEMTGTITAQ